MKIHHLLLVCLIIWGCKGSSGSSDTVSSTQKGEKEFEQYLAQKEAKFEGKMLKDLTLKSLSGKVYQLSELKGKVILLNFWFMACKPCLVELPSLKELQSKFGDQDFLLLAISLDKAEKLQNFVNEKALTYPIVPSGQAHSKVYEVSTFPTNILIDKEGIVREVSIGGSDFNATQTYMEFKPLIEQLLAE